MTTSISSRVGIALAHPNIACIKYWGNRDNALRLPVNGSISINLEGLFTRTTVTFNSSQRDSLVINDHAVTGKGLEHVSTILDLVRGMGIESPEATRTNFQANQYVHVSGQIRKINMVSGIPTLEISLTTSRINQ